MGGGGGGGGGEGLGGGSGDRVLVLGFWCSSFGARVLGLGWESGFGDWDRGSEVGFWGGSG